MDAVNPHLNPHEVIPGLLHEVVKHLEALLGHIPDLLHQPVFIGSAEITYVKLVARRKRQNLFAQLGWVRELTLDGGREETANGRAIDWLHGEGLRYADQR